MKADAKVYASGPGNGDPTTVGRLSLVIFVLALPLAAYASGQTFWLTLVGRIEIIAIAAVSLSFILVQGGLVSFGQAGPFGVGAYTSLVACEGGMTNALTVFLLAFLCAAAFSAVTGAAALRTRGVYFIMVTFAFAQMAFFTFSSLSILGGDDGMALRSRASLFGMPVLRSEIALVIFASLILAGTLFLLERASASRFGRVLKGLRDNEGKVAALGFNPYAYRLTAYTISGGLAGISGALLANQTEYVSPALMSWHQSGDFIVMAALGASLGLSGAIFGAAVLVAFEETIGGFTEHWKLVLGFLIILAALQRKGQLALLLGARRRA